MAVLAAAGVGAAVGGTAGYLGWGAAYISVGASIGWAVGATVGSLFFVNNKDGFDGAGPRLEDLRVQTSVYGAPIPDLFGAMRLAGNLIWTSGLIETYHVEKDDVGGKGGGGGTVKTEWYTYAASFAIGICEGQVHALGRIWFDGKIFLDLRNVTSQQNMDSVTIYTGSESQTADATIQSYETAADTPAYRGLCYIVFEDVQLADYSNRHPNVTVEVSKAGNFAGYEYDDASEINEQFEATGYDHSGWDSSGTWVTYNGTLDPDYAPPSYSSGWGTYCMQAHINVKNDAFYPYAKGIETWPGAGIGLQEGWLTIEFAVTSDTLAEGQTCSILSLTDEDDNLLRCQLYKTGGNLVIKAYANGGELNGNGTFYSTTTISMATQYRLVIYWGGRIVDSWYIKINDEQICAGDYIVTGRTLRIDRVDAGLWGAYAMTALFDNVKLYDTEAVYEWIGAGMGTARQLAYVLSKLCQDAGLSVDEIDTSQVSGTITGYVRANVMPARKAIEPLLLGYLIDIAEVEKKLRFEPRGNSSAATITAADLAATSNQDTPDDIVATVANETEMPTTMEVRFLHTGRFYDVDSRRYSYYFPSIENIQIIDLPIAMTAETALQSAYKLITAAWAARTRYRFYTTNKYIYLAPSDVVIVDGIRMRINSMSIDAGLLAFDASGEFDNTLLDTSITTDEGNLTDVLPFEPGLSYLVFLDCTAVNETGDSAGYYIAAYGANSDWRGCNIQYSSDGGSSFSRIKTMTSAATVGAADDALGDFAGANLVWDLKNTVTIQLTTPGKSLSSSTAAAVLNGANAAVLGVHGRWELIQFVDVVDNGGDNYTLSTLLRGRRGTEWTMADHAIADEFVLLDDAIGRIDLGVNQIGLQRTYRADSIGSLTEAAGTETFTMTSMSLKPYSVVHVAGARDGSSNLTISWLNRTRIGGEWRDNAGIALSEDTEAYEVDIMNGTSVVRTIEVTTTSASYTAAQQTTDFGSAQSGVSVKIYQISATVGRGTVSAATI